VIFVVGAAKTLLFYCDIEPKEVPFDCEFEGTQLVTGEGQARMLRAGEWLPQYTKLRDVCFPSVYDP
jgi:hypothetical protein